MSNKTITGANSVLTLGWTINNAVFIPPTVIKDYSADLAFSVDKWTVAEVMMGVDGHMAYGYINNPVPMNIKLLADSESKSIFLSVLGIMKLPSKPNMVATGNIFFPSTEERFTLTRGVLTELNVSPEVQKLLQPQEYMITWESINPVLAA